MTTALQWTHATGDISENGASAVRTATGPERAGIARALGLLACDSLVARYGIKSLAHGRFRITGEMEADIVQACVVSLEPVPAHLKEPISAEFRPAHDIVDEPGEASVLEGTDIEPIENEHIDAGRLVFELLSAALDPYPRKEGVEFDWKDRLSAEDLDRQSPFAVLAKLKAPR